MGFGLAFYDSENQCKNYISCKFIRDMDIQSDYFHPPLYKERITIEDLIKFKESIKTTIQFESAIPTKFSLIDLLMYDKDNEWLQLVRSFVGKYYVEKQQDRKSIQILWNQIITRAPNLNWESEFDECWKPRLNELLLRIEEAIENNWTAEWSY